MDREQSLEIIKAYKQRLTDSTSNQLDGDIQAFETAIEALEQQPCENTISREDVLDEINRIGVKAFRTYNDYSELFDFVDSLPSVSTEKTGRWIESNGVEMFVCSVCNESFYPMPTCLGKPLMKYCPNCGCRMMEVEE